MRNVLPPLAVAIENAYGDLLRAAERARKSWAEQLDAEMDSARSAYRDFDPGPGRGS
jgi:hypothetical protein